MLVIGVDAALVNTGVAAIQDGKATWRATVKVQGDPEDTGPRFAELRRGFETLVRRMFGRAEELPAVVMVEQPEHGVREGHDVGAILKLYGAFAVVYAESVRLFPEARVIGVTPEVWKGRMGKDLTARIMACKYGVKRFANLDEADALALADYAWDVAVAEAKRRERDFHLT